MSAADDTAAAEHAAVLEPCSLLSPELASVLNPVVVYAYKASGLPDRPATKQQLDTLCEPVKLKAVWPPLVRPSSLLPRIVMASSILCPQQADMRPVCTLGPMSPRFMFTNTQLWQVASSLWT
jgi:hypothetical protein